MLIARFEIKIYSHSHFAVYAFNNSNVAVGTGYVTVFFAILFLFGRFFILFQTRIRTNQHERVRKQQKTAAEN